MDTYTTAEIDQLSGALLFLGRVHNVLANTLDTTRYHEDTGLIEYLNHAPAGLVLDMLPTTALLLAEVKARIEELQGAVDAALDSCAQRVEAEGAQFVPEGADAFSNIMHIEFGKKRKKNGG